MKYTTEELNKYGIKSIQILSEQSFNSVILFAHYDGYQESHKISRELVQSINNGADGDFIVEELIDNYIKKLKNINEI